MPCSLAVEKIKYNKSKWNCSSWSASDQLESGKSPMSRNSGNHLMYALSTVDPPEVEWVQFIKINFMAFLFGGAVQFLLLEGFFYQQSNIGKGSWKFKVIVIQTCLGTKVGAKGWRSFFLYSFFLHPIWTTSAPLNLPTASTPSQLTT